MAAQDFESPEQIRDFLNSHLQIEAVAGTGTLTGYFVPDYEAVNAPTDEFSQAVRGRPADLVYVPGSQMTPTQPGAKVAARKSGGAYVPYYSRAEIEHMPASTQYYMRPEDYFLRHADPGLGLPRHPRRQTRLRRLCRGQRPALHRHRLQTMTDRACSPPTRRRATISTPGWRRIAAPTLRRSPNADARYAFFAIVPDQTEPDGAAGLPLPPGSAR